MSEPLKFIARIEKSSGSEKSRSWGGGEFVLYRSNRSYYGPTVYRLRSVAPDEEIESQIAVRSTDLRKLGQMLIDAAASEGD